MASGAFINRAIFTPTAFSALPPHMQTEAALLAAEFGIAPGVVAASVDLSAGAMRSILRARHAYRLPVAAAAEKEKTSIRPSNRLRIAVLLRGLGADERPVRLPVSRIMAELDIAHVSATRALRQMLADGWIVRTEASSPVEAAAYRLTESGMSAAAETT